MGNTATTASARILVAEDDKALRHYLCRMLRWVGHMPIPAPTGKEALRFARALNPDMIVLDAHLGDLTGYEVCRRLKGEKETLSIPVLMISGTLVDGENENTARKLGVLDYMLKPLDWPRFRKVVGAGLSQAKRPQAQGRESASRGTVLMLDDDQEWRSLVRVCLKQEGYDVVASGEESEFVELALRLRPDCVVLDYQLKGLTAGDLCRDMQSRPELKDIRVIVLTAHAGERIGILGDFADYFVEKNKNLEELAAAVKAAMRRKRLDADSLTLGDLRLEGSSCGVYYKGLKLKELPLRQFQCFFTLVSRCPQGVSRLELARKVFAKSRLIGNSKALDMLISRLRENLGSQLDGRIRGLRDYGWVYEPEELNPASAADPRRAAVVQTGNARVKPV